MPDPSTIREATSLAETTTGTAAGAGSGSEARSKRHLKKPPRL